MSQPDLLALAKQHGATVYTHRTMPDNPSVAFGNMAQLAAFVAALTGSVPIYEQRLRAVLDVVQRYLPPDGIHHQAALSEIIGLVDPWPAAPAALTGSVPDGIDYKAKYLQLTVQTCRAEDRAEAAETALAALMEAPAVALPAEPRWTNYDSWFSSLAPDDKYNFDTEGRGYKKDAGEMMRLTWEAAKASNVAPAAQAERLEPSQFQGPKKWTQEEIDYCYMGIRWINAEGVQGRPTQHDVLAYFDKHGEALPLEFAKAEPVAKPDDQAVFEGWLARVCPSGDVEAVHAQWLASADYADWLDDQPRAEPVAPPVTDGEVDAALAECSLLSSVALCEEMRRALEGFAKSRALAAKGQA